MKKNPISRHHLIPKERVKKGTHKTDQSKKHHDAVLKLYRDKHDAWHFLWGNMTLDEIIKCLQRIKRIKLK